MAACCSWGEVDLTTQGGHGIVTTILPVSSQFFYDRKGIGGGIIRPGREYGRFICNGEYLVGGVMGRNMRPYKMTAKPNEATRKKKWLGNIS